MMMNEAEYMHLQNEHNNWLKWCHMPYFMGLGYGNHFVVQSKWLDAKQSPKCLTSKKNITIFVKSCRSI